METTDLKQLEDDSLQHFRRDGIGEILASDIWFALAVLVNFRITQTHIIAGLLVLLGISFVFRKLWNQKIIYPRLGYVQARKDVRYRWMTAHGRRLLGVVLGMFVWAALTLFAREAGFAMAKRASLPSQWNFDTFDFYLVSLTLLGISARRSDHFYAILAWVAIQLYLAVQCSVNPMYGMIISAAVALVLGIRKLRRFLRENPVLEGEINGND